MVKKPRRMRTFARTASKSMEKHLIENAKKVAADPYIVLPDYEDDYSDKYLGKLKKKLSKVHDAKDDQKKLEKYSKKKDLRGAVAAAMLIADSGKAPYLAVAHLPNGEVSYAHRSRAPKEQVIAVQHFDDPILRLLSIKDLALKKNLHVYSWDNGFVSTGDTANPPQEFIEFLLRKVELRRTGDVATCYHLSPKKVKNQEDIDDTPYLRIQWHSANIAIGICKKCAQASGGNTIFTFSKYFIQPDVAEDFTIKVIAPMVEGFSSQQETQQTSDYLAGKKTDADLITTNIEQRWESLKESGDKMFVLDGTSFGKNMEKFIDELHPKNYERQGLKFILERVDEPIVVNDVSPNDVLEKYWDDYGLKALTSILNNKDRAEEFFSLHDTPSNILKEALSYREEKQVLSNLPQYDSLPPLSRFADRVAKTYKTRGKSKAINALKKRPDDSKGKSLAYAFLLVFGKAADKKWQFSDVEIEYGEFLQEYVKRLLDAKGKNYHEALQKLLTACGVTKEIKPRE